jgi:hypothetical protein
MADHADIDPVENFFGGGGDRIPERKDLDLDCPERGTQAAEFSGHKFWARNCYVSTRGAG